MNPICNECVGSCTQNHSMRARTIPVPSIPRNVMDAIYSCRVCNPSGYTLYRCKCDMAPSVKRVPKVTEPLPTIFEGVELPADMVSRCEAINKIFESKEKK